MKCATVGVRKMFTTKQGEDIGEKRGKEERGGEKRKRERGKERDCGIGRGSGFLEGPSSLYSV